MSKSKMIVALKMPKMVITITQKPYMIRYVFSADSFSAQKLLYKFIEPDSDANFMLISVLFKL